MSYYPKRFKDREEYLSYRRKYYRENRHEWVNWQKRDKEENTWLFGRKANSELSDN